MFQISEFIDVILMTLGVGYIFMDIIRKPMHEYDPLAPKDTWTDLKYACLITAPGVIFHELAHKLAAMSLGLEATFHAAYNWLFFGIFLKLIGSGFIFFVPGYVSISNIASPLQSAYVAFAGPALNGILYLVAVQVLNSKRPTNFKHVYFWELTKRINGFLFIFNMLPFFFFDGAKVFGGLFQYLTTV